MKQKHDDIVSSSFEIVENSQEREDEILENSSGQESDSAKGFDDEEKTDQIQQYQMHNTPKKSITNADRKISTQNPIIQLYQTADNQTNMFIKKPKAKIFDQIKEIVDPTIEHMTTRYSLFYADDIVQDGIQTKTKVQYQKLIQGKNGNLDERFKKYLREGGIYFDIDISPSSPRKRNMFDAGRKQSSDIEILNDETEVKSPTFKRLSGDFGSDKFNKQPQDFSQGRVVEALQEFEDDLALEQAYYNTEQRMDQMLLSPTEVVAFSQGLKLNQNALFKRDNTYTQEISLNNTEESFRQRVTKKKSYSLDNFNHMCQQASIVHQNYQSPGLKEIKNTLRRREIDEIDTKVRNNIIYKSNSPTTKKRQIKQKTTTCAINKGETMKQLQIIGSPMQSNYYINGSLENLECNNDESSPSFFAQIHKKQIIEENEDYENKNSSNNSSKYFEKNLENNEAQEVQRNFSFKRTESLFKPSNINSNKKLRQQALNYENSFDANPRQVQNPNQYWNELQQIQIDEPKSALFRHCTLGFQKLDNGMQMNIQQRKNSALNLNDDYNSEDYSNQLSIQSSNSHNSRSDHANRISRMKSIHITKYGIGKKKLARSKLIMEMSEPAGRNKTVGYKETFVYDESANLNKNRQQSQKIEIPIIFGQPQNQNQMFFKQQNDNQKASCNEFLGIKKLETEQPFKTSGLVDSVNQSGNKNTASLNKNSKRGMNNDISQTIKQRSKQTSNQHFTKSVKKQRKRDVRKLKKSTKHQEEEEFIKNQEKCLIHLKNLAEMLKGHKIQEGYEAEVHEDTTNGDMTAQHNKEYYDQESNKWIVGLNGLMVQQSFNSRDHSISTPQDRQGLIDSSKNNKNNFIFTQDKQSENPRLSIPSNLSTEMKLYNIEKVSNHNRRKSIHEVSGISIGGVGNNEQFDLNIKEFNFNSHRSKSSQSCASIVYDLISQQSKNAAELQKSKKRFSLEKSVDKKFLLSSLSPKQLICKKNKNTILAQLADQNKLKMIRNQYNSVQIQKNTQEPKVEKIQKNIFLSDINTSIKFEENKVEKKNSLTIYPFQLQKTGKWVDQPISPTLPNQVKEEEKIQENLSQNNNSRNSNIHLDTFTNSSFGKVQGMANGNRPNEKQAPPFQIHMNYLNPGNEELKEGTNTQLNTLESERQTYDISHERSSTVPYIQMKNVKPLEEQLMEVEDEAQREFSNRKNKKIQRQPAPVAPVSSLQNSLTHQRSHERYQLNYERNNSLMNSQQLQNQNNRIHDQQQHLSNQVKRDSEQKINRFHKQNVLQSSTQQLFSQSSASEISFKKSHAHLINTNNDGGQFQMNISKMENFSLMSPGNILEYSLQNSIQKISSNSPKVIDNKKQDFFKMIAQNQDSRQEAQVLQQTNSKKNKLLKGKTTNLKSGLMDIIQNLDQQEQKLRYPDIQVQQEYESQIVSLRQSIIEGSLKLQKKKISQSLEKPQMIKSRVQNVQFNKQQPQIYQRPTQRQNNNNTQSQPATLTNSSVNSNKNISKYEQEFINQRIQKQIQLSSVKKFNPLNSFEKQVQQYNVKIVRQFNPDQMNIVKQKSQNESQEKIRKIEQQMRNNQKSNDTINQNSTDRKSGNNFSSTQKQAGTTQSSFMQSVIEFDQVGNKKSQSKRVPNDQTNQTSYQNYQPRQSIGGLTNLNVPQFSEQQQLRHRDQSDQNANDFKKSLDDDLDELQSMFTRHHDKQQDQKKKRGQSNYNGAVNSQYTSKIAINKKQQNTSKSQFNNFSSKTKGRVQQYQNHERAEIYKIDDQGNDSGSIFNEGQSHLNEDFTDFTPGQQVNGPDFNIQVPQTRYKASNSRFIPQDNKFLSYQPSIKNSEFQDPRFLSPTKKQLVFSQQTSMTINKQVSILSKQNEKEVKYPYTQKHTLTENPKSRKTVDVPKQQEHHKNSTHKSNVLQSELDGFNKNIVTAFDGHVGKQIDSKRSKKNQVLVNQLRKQKEQLPVYYDSHAGTRYSIASEMIQAQQPKRVINQHNQPITENPFEQVDQNNLISRNSGSKGSNPISGKSGVSRITGNWAQEALKLSGPLIIEDDDEYDAPGSPFDLKLKDNIPSEPTNAKNRQMLIKK